MPSPEDLFRILERYRRVALFLHDNPDPDGLASAFGLQRLLSHRLPKCQTRILAGGMLGRAENQTLVKLCKIHLSHVDRYLQREGEATILIDCQPGTGNNSFPPRSTPAGIIDHHPRRRRTKADFIDIRPKVGATASIVTGYLKEAGIEISSNLATALFYGVQSEAFNFLRFPHPLDRQAYRDLAPFVNHQLLNRILVPPLQRDYFVSLSQALERTFVYRHITITALEHVPNPDLIAQFADFFLRHQRVTWAFCVGPYRNQIVFSIRTANRNRRAETLARRLAGTKGKAGGHDQFAGGAIPLEETLSDAEQIFSMARRFLELLGYQDIREIHPLVSPQDRFLPFLLSQPPVEG